MLPRADFIARVQGGIERSIVLARGDRAAALGFEMQSDVRPYPATSQFGCWAAS